MHYKNEVFIPLHYCCDKHFTMSYNALHYYGISILGTIVPIDFRSIRV